MLRNPLIVMDEKALWEHNAFLIIFTQNNNLIVYMKDVLFYEKRRKIKSFNS